MTINHITFRDMNGNRRVKIEIDTIGALYAEFCSGARIKGDAALRFDAVLERLKSRFGYRIQRKCKTPNVTAVFETETEMTNEVFDAIVYSVTDGRVEHSRRRYMNGVRRCSHEEYYKQFVTDSVLSLTTGLLPDLLKSKKECFNDIHYLTHKVQINGVAAELCRIAQATTFVGYRNGGITLSDSVCIAKAAARIMLSDHLKKNDTASKETIITDDVAVVEYNNGFHFTQNGKVIAPRDVFLMLKHKVPVRFNHNVGKMIANYMLLDTNKAILQRILQEN